jgi:Domain of unknown function DUF29
MSRSDHRALESHLQVLLMHLLKWRYQPAGRQTGHNWADSIREARTQVADGLQTHPGMHQQVPAILVCAWRKARREASHQTGLPLATFPQACPWTLEQLLDGDFWPEEASPASC